MPVPSDRAASEPRPLLPIEGYRARQCVAEARRPGAQFERSDAGVVLDAEFVSGGPRTAALTTGAFSAQFVAQPTASDEAALSGYRSAMAYGNEAYRRAGAEPSLAPESASVVNLAV